MTIDYSPDDLQQLLSVSSAAEYMSSLFGLHESFKSIIGKFETLSSDKMTELLDDVKLGIAESQLAIQGSLNKDAKDIASDSSLPPLFNDLDEKNVGNMFSKNFAQYSLAIKLLNKSYDSLEGRDESNLQSALCDSCVSWLARLPKAEEPKAEEPKAEEPKAEEPKVEEPKAEEPKVEEPKAEEPKAEEPKAEEPKAEEPKAEELVEADDYSSIADISDSMSNNLSQFLENYDKLYNGKQEVNSCIDQLSTFASKGLLVDSAIEPLKTQLKSFEDMQAQYLTKLVKINQEFDSIIKDMCSAADGVLLKS